MPETIYDGDGYTEHSSRDSLTMYLREAGKTPLLTPEQELQLAKLVEQGDKRARIYMIKANLRLVVKIAREYENLGLPLLDLINEGNMGLMKAVDRFKTSKGAKLSTYAAFWIKQMIKRALSNNGRTIRLPVHMGGKIWHMQREARRLADEFGRDPTDEELALHLGVPVKKIEWLREISAAPVQLDAPLKRDESDSELIGDIIPDPNAPDPSQIGQASSDIALLSDALETLSEREQAILRLRFGLDGEDPKTLDEVGEQFKLTRERIRQIQEQALVRLRRPMHTNGSKVPNGHDGARGKVRPRARRAR